MTGRMKLWILLPLFAAALSFLVLSHGPKPEGVGRRLAPPAPAPWASGRVRMPSASPVVLANGRAFTPRPAPVEATPEVVTIPSAVAQPTSAAPANDGMTAARTHYPEPNEAAQEERDTKIQALRDSGAGGAPYRAALEDVERAWLTLDKSAGIGVELSEWECYKSGCAVYVTLPTAEAQDRFNSLVQQSPAMSLWKGAGFRSGPIRTSSGEVETTWIFYAPVGAG